MPTSQNKNIFGQLFAEGGCIYDGNILEDFEEINDVETCQTACQITINAYYYTYEPLFKLCICYDSKDRHRCNFIGGPATPSLIDCQNLTPRELN